MFSGGQSIAGVPASLRYPANAKGKSGVGAPPHSYTGTGTETSGATWGRSAISRPGIGVHSARFGKRKIQASSTSTAWWSTPPWRPVTRTGPSSGN